MISDKFLHFIYSYVIALYNPFLAFATGIGKEAYDIWRGVGAEAGDLIADWLGIFAAGL